LPVFPIHILRSEEPFPQPEAHRLIPKLIER
jgi:hypothetical protein